jgi:hypothetical protein
MRARWKTTLDASKDEAVLAVDLYNQSRRARRLEGFFVHMHMAWLYMFEAEYQQAHKVYFYKLVNGHYDRVDGEPKTWDLAKFVKEELDANDPDQAPVRKNLELTIGLRNKIEHRFEEATTLATSGYAQALLLNYEETLTARFGANQALGQELRFPIFIGTLTRDGATRLAATRKQLPAKTRQFLTEFEASMNPSIAQDHRYEFRIHLVPMLGAKTDADLAISFVREDELTDNERDALSQRGQTGTVIIREQERQVSNLNNLKPTPTARAVEAKIPFKFRVHHLARAWKKENVRPPEGDPHPERTKQDLCIYDKAHGDYLYTSAYVDRLVRKVKTVKGFRELTDLEPVRKARRDE